MKLYFVRHGESEANTRHVISNRESPFDLTDLGRWQANILADSLKEFPITAIFSSPVLRARETADVLAQAFGQSYQVTEALREYDCGILEEQSDDSSWGLHREIYEDWTVHHNYHRQPEGGECFLDIRNRFLPFIKELTEDGTHTNQHILLVGHGGLFQLMLPLVLSNIDDAFVRSHGIDHTDCIIAEQQPTGFVCLQWGQLKFGNM
jgi:2,3-bisphosphoglycerate-dependent phosphoglycerate mutase